MVLTGDNSARSCLSDKLDMHRNKINFLCNKIITAHLETGDVGNQSEWITLVDMEVNP